MDELRVLIVDDSPANLKILGSLLKDEYKVMVATNGAEALRICRTETPPRLVLLDVIMPEMDGYEVCRQIKASEQTKDIIVIFVTAMSGSDEKIKGLSVGAVDYVTKPYNAAEVLKKVQFYIHKSDSNG